jgi:hypothetical protein
MNIRYFTFGLLFIILSSCNAQNDNSYNILDNFIPSGYMGDGKNIIMKKNYKDSTRPDSLCTKTSYTAGDSGWGGVYWQYPANNWCKQKGKDFSKSGYKRITFYIKGEKGGEEVKFKAGQDCGDSFVSDELTRRLTKTWKKETIDLGGKNLSNVTGAFCWTVDSKANDGVVTFYIDDVQFEK